MAAIMPDGRASELDVAGLVVQLETGETAARAAALDVLEAAQAHHVAPADALVLGPALAAAAATEADAATFRRESLLLALLVELLV